MKRFLRNIFAALALALFVMPLSACGNIELYDVNTTGEYYFYCKLPEAELTAQGYSQGEVRQKLTTLFSARGWQFFDTNDNAQFAAYISKVDFNIQKVEGPEDYSDLEYGFFFYHYDYVLKNPFGILLDDAGINSAVEEFLDAYPALSSSVNGLTLDYYVKADSSFWRSNGEKSSATIFAGVANVFKYSTSYSDAKNNLSSDIVLRKYYLNTHGWYLIAALAGIAFIVIVTVSHNKKKKKAADMPKTELPH